MPPPPCMRQHICIQCRSRVAIQLWVGTHSLGQVPYLVILSGPSAIFGYTRGPNLGHICTTREIIGRN